MRQAVLVGRNNRRAVSPAPPCGTVVPRPCRRRFHRHPPRPARAPWHLVALLIGVSLALIATIWEAQTSELQSRFFGRWSSALSYTIEPRPNPQIAFPARGRSTKIAAIRDSQITATAWKAAAFALQSRLDRRRHWRV